MWLSVLAAPKFRSLCSPTPPPPLPPKRIPWRGPSRSRWLSAPRSGAGHRRDFQIWLAGASPRRSQTGTLDLRQGWGKRRLPDGDRMVVQGEAGWCGQQQLRARPGPWTSESLGSNLPHPYSYSHPRESQWSGYLRGEGRGGGGRAGHSEPPGARGSGERRRRAAPGSTRKRVARPSPRALTARNRPPPPGCPGHPAQGTAQPLHHAWGRNCLILQAGISKP